MIPGVAAEQEAISASFQDQFPNFFAAKSHSSHYGDAQRPEGRLKRQITCFPTVNFALSPEAGNGKVG